MFLASKLVCICMIHRIVQSTDYMDCFCLRIYTNQHELFLSTNYTDFYFNIKDIINVAILRMKTKIKAALRNWYVDESSNFVMADIQNKLAINADAKQGRSFGFNNYEIISNMDNRRRTANSYIKNCSQNQQKQPCCCMHQTNI